MEDLVKRIDQLKIKYETLKKEIARKIVGQEEIIDKILVAIFRTDIACSSVSPVWPRP